MSDVFISYSNEDRPRVKPLVDALARQGWSVWWDRTILPGKRFEEVIDAALAEARCVVVLWSKASVQSDWVRAEADEARQRGILVPALLDDVKVPLAFRGIQAANLVDWRGVPTSSEFGELSRAIAEILGAEVRPVSPGQANPAELGNRPKAEAVLPETAKHRDRSLPKHLLPGRAIMLVGAFVLASIAGLAWYFTKPIATASRAPDQTPAKSKDAAGAAGKYVRIRAGTFEMGCSMGDTECDSDEKPTHKVTLTRDFYVGEADVTGGAYRRFATEKGRNMPDAPGFPQTDEHPVVNVKWQDAVDYCKWDGGGRLPTEAEWEYAARAGTSQSRYENLDDIAWYDKNSGGGTHPVKQKQANGFGLYDMLGNVWQWTADWHDEKYYGKSPLQDPQGPPSGAYRSVRGGSWLYNSGYVRVSLRGRFQPEGRDVNLGFRCVREVP